MAIDEQQDLSRNWDVIFNKLVQLRNYSPSSQEVQTTIKEWYDILNKNFGKYSLDAFQGLGQIYIEDERFTQNIDKYSKVLTKFMSEAMEIFSVNQKKKGGSNENSN